MVMIVAIGAAVLSGGPRPTPSPSPLTGGLFDPSPSPATSANASPTTSADRSPTIAPATPTPPSPTAVPTSTQNGDSGNVSGPIDPATGSFLESTMLETTDLEPYGERRDGPVEAGKALDDYASFATNHGRAVVWQGWSGSGIVRRITDVRLAFPTSKDAIGFVAGFGDEVSRSQGLTEFEPIAVGEETRGFAARVTNPAGDQASHVLYVFRRGDLIGVSASVVVTEDEHVASDTAADIASRSGRELDDAVGIQPGQ